MMKNKKRYLYLNNEETRLVLQGIFREFLFFSVSVSKAINCCLKHQPMPPLCKGRWHGIAVTEGLQILRF